MDTKVGSSWSRKAGMPPQATEYLLQTRRAAPKQSKTRGCGASEHQQSRKSCRWAWRYRARKKQGGTEFHVRCSTIHYALMMACSSAQLQIYLLTIKQKTCIYHTSYATTCIQQRSTPHGRERYAPTITHLTSLPHAPARSGQLPNIELQQRPMLRV